MTAIENASQLRDTILARYDALSPRLQQIARFVLDDPHSAGVETLAVISERTGAPPSAIVRFAQTFGFHGAAPMQRLLKDDLLAAQPESGYHKRARQFLETGQEGEAPHPCDLLAEFASASALSLDHLGETIDRAAFERSVTLLQTAETVYVAGFRRSFPVASYLAYSLQRSGKRAILADGIGGLGRLQIGQIGERDLLIGISFSPYAPEMMELIDAAAGAGSQVAMITDSLVGPMAKTADCVLQIRDAEVRGFRTLAASMCLVQALAIAYAFEYKP